MLKDLLDRILQLSNPEVLTCGNRSYSTKPLNPVRSPEPDSLAVTTLTALVDYVKESIDGVTPLGEFLIHVEAPDSVRLSGHLEGDFMQRLIYVHAVPLLPKISFESFQDVEFFNPFLQANFADSPDKASILKLIGNLREEQVTTVQDDGVTQEVLARAGIAKVEKVEVPNPVGLRPFCTFPEVEQPLRPFVFRMRSGPSCALFPADGGAWRNTAMKSIKEFLSEQLPEMTIIA